MIKQTIGAAICLISSVIALIIYSYAMRYSENMLVLQKLSFFGTYYPVLIGLDLILLLFSVMKGWLDGKGRNMGDAVIFILYAALNLFCAIKMYPVMDAEFYFPGMFIKTAGFAALYLLQAVFSFVKNKRAIRIISLIAFIAMSLCIYLKGRAFGELLSYLLDGLLRQTGREWPEKYYWLTNFALTASEMILPLMRILGLMLYDTKDKQRRLAK